MNLRSFPRMCVSAASARRSRSRVTFLVVSAAARPPPVRARHSKSRRAAHPDVNKIQGWDAPWPWIGSPQRFGSGLGNAFSVERSTSCTANPTRLFSEPQTRQGSRSSIGAAEDSNSVESHAPHRTTGIKTSSTRRR